MFSLMSFDNYRYRYNHHSKAVTEYPSQSRKLPHLPFRSKSSPHPSSNHFLTSATTGQLCLFLNCIQMERHSMYYSLCLAIA